MSVAIGQRDLTKDEKRFFREAFARARAATLRDAESFDEIVFVLERLGSTLLPHGTRLGDFEGCIEQAARVSPLAAASDDGLRPSFGSLYSAVRQGRNDAFHVGAFARHLANQAVRLSLVLEDALTREDPMIVDLMVRNPVTIEDWQQIGWARQLMLENSFSYLPLLVDGRWHLLQDHAIARYLRRGEGGRQRRIRLSTPIVKAKADGLELRAASTLTPGDPLEAASVATADGHPVLICDRGRPNYLIGILTAFDLL